MRRMLLTLLVVTALAACTTDSDSPGSESGPAADTATCDPELVHALGRWADAGFSGSLAITTEGESSCRAAFGLADVSAREPNTAETVFAIGSVSKAFTAAAVFDLIDAGILALDDAAGAFLPDFGGPAAEATLEQLLLHTSGLTGSHGSDHEPLGRDAAIEAISDLETASEPGTEFRYSNSGYSLLALIVDEVSETTYRDHLAAEILNPSGDHRYGAFWDGEPAPAGPRARGYEDGEPADSVGGFEGPHWALDGNGDLAMTAGDLAMWTGALFSGDVIAPTAVELLIETRFEPADGPVEAPGWAVYDAEVYGVPVYLATGGGGDTGHHAVTAWLPESRQTIAVTSNTAEVTAGELIEALGPALAAGEPIPVPEGQRFDVDPAELAARVGGYRLESGGGFSVEVDADHLVVTATGVDAVAAMSQLTDGFTAADVERHEEQVMTMLRGETPAGREERDLVEATLGQIERIELAGTVVEDFELRTYLMITAEGESTLAWYALDEHGGLAAALLDTEPPAFKLIAVGEGAYRHENLNGAGLGVQVAFDGDLMTVTGPAGTVEARRTP